MSIDFPAPVSPVKTFRPLEKNISALAWYWTFLLIVWLMFFLMVYIFDDAFIEWCKSLI